MSRMELRIKKARINATSHMLKTTRLSTFIKLFSKKRIFYLTPVNFALFSLREIVKKSTHKARALHNYNL